jgi:hypothetical protein
MSKLNDFWWFFSDLFFPRIRPLSSKQIKEAETRHLSEKLRVQEHVAALPPNEKCLNGYFEEISKFIELEKTRKQSIETRLTSIIGLTSISGTIVFSGLVAQASGTIKVDSVFLKWLLAVGAFYLTIQICNALFAAFRGVSRTSYIAESASDVIPSPKTPINWFLREKIIKASFMLEDHREINNLKMSCMAVAHCAMRNFVAGLLMFAFMTMIYILNVDTVAVKAPHYANVSHNSQLPTKELVLIHALRIGPFLDGEHQLNSKELLACVINSLEPYENNFSSGWQIIGSVDKRELRPNLAKIYGSNQGLAMSRSVWVRDKVLNGINGFKSDQAILTVAGPVNVGRKVENSDLQLDRMVDIFIWRNQPVKYTSSELNKPKICH